MALSMLVVLTALFSDNVRNLMLGFLLLLVMMLGLCGLASGWGSHRLSEGTQLASNRELSSIFSPMALTPILLQRGVGGSSAG